MHFKKREELVLIKQNFSHVYLLYLLIFKYKKDISNFSIRLCSIKCNIVTP